jgi:hypothetical protein
MRRAKGRREEGWGDRAMGRRGGAEEQRSRGAEEQRGCTHRCGGVKYFV